MAMRGLHTTWILDDGYAGGRADCHANQDEAARRLARNHYGVGEADGKNRRYSVAQGLLFLPEDRS